MYFQRGLTIVCHSNNERFCASFELITGKIVPANVGCRWKIERWNAEQLISMKKVNFRERRLPNRCREPSYITVSNRNANPCPHVDTQRCDSLTGALDLSATEPKAPTIRLSVHPTSKWPVPINSASSSVLLLVQGRHKASPSLLLSLHLST